MRLRSILAAALVATSALPQQPAQKATIAGTVFDSGGHPLRRTRLTLIPERDYLPFDLFTPGRTLVPVAESDADGKFSFVQVEAGEYRLVSAKTGFFPEPKYRDGLRVKLIPGDQITDLRFTLYQGAVITGKLTDEDGDPFMRATVALWVRGPTSTGRPGAFWVYEAACDSFGEYRIAGVAPGSYLLRADTAQPPPSKSKDKYVATFYGNTVDETRASPIEVTLGATLQGRNIIMGKLPLVHVRGRIVGEILAGETVTISPFRVTLASDGTFETEVTPGRYNVIGLEKDGPSRPNAWTLIDVGYAGLENVELVSSLFSLRGRVIVEGADPEQTSKVLAGFKVLPSFLNGPVSVSNLPHGVRLPILLPPNAPVNPDGTFVLNRVMNAEYKFGDDTPRAIRSAESQFPHGTYVASIRLGDKDVSAGMDLRGGATSDLLVITLKQTPGEITGTVKTQDGSLLTGAIVTLAPDPAKPNQNYLSRRIETDPKGEFGLSDLAPGRYRIFAWEDLPHFAELDPDFLEKHRESGVSITIEDSSKQSVSLTARPSGN